MSYRVHISPALATMPPAATFRADSGAFDANTGRWVFSGVTEYTRDDGAAADPAPTEIRVPDAWVNALYQYPDPA